MKDKKKFKDTRVGKLLKDNGLLDQVMDIAEKAGIPGVSPSIAILNKVKDLAMGSDAANAVIPMTPELQMQIIEAIKLDQVELDMILKDIQNAREHDARIQEAEHASWLAKNTGYILDFFIVGATFMLVFMLAFKLIPEGNRDLFFTALGTAMTLSVTVVTFHRGSTAKSQQKDSTIQRLSGK